jgi:predicted ArsR family transcriptional regulator
MDRLEAIGDPERRRALLYARSCAAAITVDELAAALGIHRNVARARLDRLVEASFLEAHFERRTGRTGPGAGRPAKTYSVAPELSAVEFPFRRYEALIGLLMAALPSRGRARRLREVGVAFGEELARSVDLACTRTLPGAVEMVCLALGQLGYQATVESAGPEEAWIRTPTCPMRPLVVAGEEAVEVDRGMWAGLVGAALDGVDVGDVVCEGQDCLRDHDACRVRIRVRGGSDSG